MEEYEGGTRIGDRMWRSLVCGRRGVRGIVSLRKSDDQGVY